MKMVDFKEDESISKSLSRRYELTSKTNKKDETNGIHIYVETSSKNPTKNNGRLE